MAILWSWLSMSCTVTACDGGFTKPMTSSTSLMKRSYRACSRASDLALDALEQALYERSVNDKSGLIHHSDRGVQYLSIRYAERLTEAGIESSVGSVGDSYDNALAETINGLYKTEVIRQQGPWRNIEDVEFATLTWVDWFNNRRIFEPIGNVPPTEKEIEYYQQQEGSAMAA